MPAILQAFDDLAHGRSQAYIGVSSENRSVGGLWEERDSGVESVSIIVNVRSKGVLAEVRRALQLKLEPGVKWNESNPEKSIWSKGTLCVSVDGNDIMKWIRAQKAAKKHLV